MTKRHLAVLALSLAALAACKGGGNDKTTTSGPDDSAERLKAAEKWIDAEFQPSTLTREQQLTEMKWFIEAAKPFRGQKIQVVSETIDTHSYESKTMAK